MLLEPLHEEEVLPKRTGVRTGRKRREVVQDSIADANVTKVDFLAFFQFITQITSKRRYAPDDEALFKNIQVPFNRRTAQFCFARQIVIRNLLTYVLS